MGDVIDFNDSKTKDVFNSEMPKRLDINGDHLENRYIRITLESINTDLDNIKLRLALLESRPTPYYGED